VDRTTVVKRIGALLLLLVLMITLAYNMDSNTKVNATNDEMMYFPSGCEINRLTLGNQALFADAIWLWFIQYYGKHRLTDRKYDRMYHILDVLTTLDPAFLKAYQLGSMLLTHDAQRPDQAKNLLKKGMYSNPDAWTLPFYYGFLHFVFLGDYQTAQIFFRFAGQKPGAPDMPRRWEAYVTYKKIDDLQTALQLWLDLYNSTTNPEEKRVAELYIKDIKMKIDINNLNEQVKSFTAKFGRAPSNLDELVEYGFVESIPLEPHGASYKIEHGEVFSTHKGDWPFGGR
jgi:hypothetical protein